MAVQIHQYVHLHCPDLFGNRKGRLLVGVDELIEGGNQAATLTAAVIRIGANADDLKTCPVVTFDQLYYLCRHRMLRHVGREIS